MPKYTPFTPSSIIKPKGNSSIFSTDNAIVMGILNITDDSFYDGGKYVKEGNIIVQTKKMKVGKLRFGKSPGDSCLFVWF